MKIGDLVWVEGHSSPAIFVEWCSDKDPHAEYGSAYLLINGNVRSEHNDWWTPCNPKSKDSNESR